MSVVIYTDSTCDGKKDWYAQHDVHLLPLTYLIGEEEFVDSVEDDEILAFYQKVKEGAMPKTSAVNTEAFIASWTPHLEAGNDVVFMGLGKKLSATTCNAQNAAKELQKSYPERQVVVVDSKNAAGAITDMILRACQWREQGLSAREIGEQLEQAADHYQTWVCVDDLQHLKRGGRLSSAAAVIGSILNIKPIITIDHQGCLEAVGKVKGSKKAIKFFMEKLRENAANPREDPIWISYGLLDDTANEIEKAIKQEFHNDNITKRHIGCVLSSHAGPYTAALFFRSK